MTAWRQKQRRLRTGWAPVVMLAGIASVCIPAGAQRMTFSGVNRDFLYVDNPIGYRSYAFDQFDLKPSHYNLIPRYDRMGNYLTAGELVYSVDETRPGLASFGGMVRGRYAARVKMNYAVQRDTYRGVAYNLMVLPANPELVARQLAEAGLRPRLAVRRPVRGALLARLPAEVVAADLTSPSSLARDAEGMDSVIHLGARAAFESHARLRATMVEGSRSLVRAAAAAGVRRLVYGSSLFVYPSLPNPIGPGTKPDPRLDYGRAKLEAETILAEESARAGISFVAIRLPHVYGARDLFFSSLARGRGLIAVPGRGTNRFSHMHVSDAARVLISAAEGSVEGAWPVGRSPHASSTCSAVARPRETRASRTACSSRSSRRPPSGVVDRRYRSSKRTSPICTIACHRPMPLAAAC